MPHDTGHCRAKDPRDCRYHGAALQMNEAAAIGDYEAYQQAKTKFEAAAKDLKPASGIRGWFAGEQTVATIADSPANPFRYTASLEISHNHDPNGITHHIEVSAPTRAEALDRIVQATKTYVDELRASHKRLAWKGEHYTVHLITPDLNGRKDDDSEGSGSGLMSLNRLVAFVGMSRYSQIRAFNSRLLRDKQYNGTITSAERDIYRRTQKLEDNWRYTETDWVDPANGAVTNTWQGESDHDREKRQRQEDQQYKLRRAANLAHRAEVERNSAATARAEARNATKRSAAQQRAHAQHQKAAAQHAAADNLQRATWSDLIAPAETTSTHHKKHDGESGAASGSHHSHNTHHDTSHGASHVTNHDSGTHPTHHDFGGGHHDF